MGGGALISASLIAWLKVDTFVIMYHLLPVLSGTRQRRAHSRTQAACQQDELEGFKQFAKTTYTL